MIRYDSIPLDRARYTAEGYLMDTPVVTSVGIFEYKNADGSTRRELRLPEHVFKKDSLQSYKGKPIIITHDSGYITKNNVEEEAVGTIISDGIPDGNDVRAEIVIHDTDELKRCGLKELSLGYSLDLIEEPGEWNGEQYDAIQTNIIINHLALVANARAGEQARLNIDGNNDKSEKGGNSMATKKKTRRKDEDDLAVELAKAVLEENADPESAADEEEAQTTAETPEESAKQPQPSEELLQSIRDRKDRRDAEEDSPQNLDEANEIISQQNEDIGALLEMLDKKNEEEKQDCSDTESDEDDESTDEDESEPGDEDEQATALNADSIDAIVRARASLMRIGEKYNIDGLDRMDMRSAMCKVIEAATPGLRLDSESEIKGAFKAAVSVLNARKDVSYQRKQMSSHGVRNDSFVKSEASAARQRMIEKRLKGEQ